MRGASATWDVISGLISATLDVANAIPSKKVHDALADAAGVCRMLIAGGHIDRHPMTLIAGDLRCDITTVSGSEALSLNENLNAIPGASAADSFTIHLPTPEPLAQKVIDAAARNPHLSDLVAPSPVSQRSAEAADSAVDLAALREAVDRS